MAKKPPPSPELVAEWREIHKRFVSCAAIAGMYGYSARQVSSALYPEYQR